MNNFHLIGQSIQTSLSPLIHNYLFKLKNLPQHKYSIYPKDNHLLTLNDLEKQNINGISITIPFKLSYKKQIQSGTLGSGSIVIKSQQKPKQQLSKKAAQSILSKRFIINTIRKNNHQEKTKQPNFLCFNTDIFGIRQCIRKNEQYSKFYKDDIHSNSRPSPLKAIIIGGGATAQTFMSYFEQHSIKMIVINRSIQKVINLKQNAYYSHIHNVISFLDKNSSFSESETYQNIFSSINNLIVINTLPTTILKQNLDKQQNNSFRNILKSNKLENIFYMDVNYRDTQHTLLNAIQSFKNKATHVHKLSTGLDMLIWQGILQNYLFCQEDNNNILTQIQQNQFHEQFNKIMTKLKQQGKA